MKDGWGPLLLVIYVVSQLTSSYFMSTTMQGAQRILLMVLPVVFVPFILNFPAGLMIYWLTTNLWTTGQGARHPQADAEARRRPRSGARARPPKDEPAAGDRRTARRDAEGRRADAGRASRSAGPPRRVKRKRGGGGRSDDRRDHASRRPARRSARRNGAALRELERRVPGLDRDAIRFQVVSEGERGLLGVGYTPAPVIATADVPDAPPPRRRRAPRGDDAARRRSSRELLERTIAARGVPGDGAIEESDEELVATLVGARPRAC